MRDSETIAVTATIDTFSVTLPHCTGLHDLLSLFSDLAFEPGRPRNGYDRCMASVLPGLTICWHSVREDMGVNLYVSGEGCARLLSGRWTVQGLVRSLMDAGGRFARLDWAIDERRGLISYETVRAICDAQRRVEAGGLRPVARRGGGPRLVDNGSSAGGWCLYVGEGQTECLLRVYCKASEQRVPGPWVRVEMQWRKGRAQQCAERIYHSFDVEADMAAMIRGCCDFLDLDHQTVDVTRRRRASWWLEVMGTARLVVPVLRESLRSVERAWAHLERNCSKSLALVASALGGGRDDLGALFGRLLAKGSERLKPADLARVAEFHDRHGLPTFKNRAMMVSVT